MCAPGIGSVIGIGAGILSAAAQYQAAEQDYQAKSAAWKQNVVNAEASARDDSRQILTKQLEERGQLVQKDEVSLLDQAQKQSSVENSAASSGVLSGVSVDNLLSDIAGKSELNRTFADENYKFQVADTQEKLRASDTTLRARIDSFQRPIEPSPLSFIAGVATSVAGGVKSLSAGGGAFGD